MIIHYSKCTETFHSAHHSVCLFVTFTTVVVGVATPSVGVAKDPFLTNTSRGHTGDGVGRTYAAG